MTSTAPAPTTARAPATRRTRPRLKGRPRRLVRAAHVVAAGGWLGLVVSMLVLGIAAGTAGPTGMPAGTTYRVMHLLGGTVVPPLAVATLLTGVALSVLTPWGLVRHWWVVVKTVLGLAVVVTAVTLTDAWLEQAIAARPAAATGATRLVATSGAHLAMLVLATVVSVDKPWGRTPFGRRRLDRPEVGTTNDGVGAPGATVRRARGEHTTSP